MKTSIVACVLAGITCAAHAETYTIDPKHTFASFEIDHFGLARQSGRFDRTSGTIAYDPAAKSGSADVSIEVASVTTGDAERDQHLTKPEFFDAARFPRITFKSSAFRFEGDKLTAIDGDLTVRGVTKPVTLRVSHIGCKVHPAYRVPSCGANAETQIKRSDFGVNAFLPAISDDVTLKLAVEVLGKKTG